MLDLVPGRSGTVHENWLEERGEQFRSGIQIATLDPFQGYKNAIDDQLQNATSVLDAFHIVKLAGDALDETSGQASALGGCVLMEDVSHLPGEGRRLRH